ncbi:MAG: PD-(D/E)XK nuclease family protein [Solirubrobacteraceae bacterium]
MPLTLVIGPANSAKAGEVLGAYAAQAPRGAVLVVPTASDVRHYEQELAGTGLVFATVLTFTGLMGEIGRRTGWHARALSGHQRDAILRRALAVQTSPGLRRATGDLIAELTRNMITAPRFAAALRTWTADAPSRRADTEALSGVVLRYARELQRSGWVDRERYAWGALDALRATPDRWGRDAVFFYGFDDLTPLERDGVETLDRIAGAAVTVSLTYEAGHPALTARAQAVQELRPLAQEVVELPAGDEHYAPAARSALHALERGLFDPDAPSADPGDAVVLLEAGGARAEAELIAARVLALVEAGVAPDQIAVVRRSLSLSAGLLQRVLAEYGVPAAWGGETAFGHTPIGHAIRGAARCAWLPAGRASAADLLAYLRAPGRMAEPEPVDRVELALAQHGERSAQAARRRLGAPLPELDALATAPDPSAALLTLARDLMAAPHRGRAPALDAAESLDARALVALADLLADLAALQASRSGPELLERLDELTVPGVPARTGAVTLAEPMEIRARRFRVVFVGGLQEGAFPLPARGEPFLSERDRRELAASTGLRLPLSGDALDHERYLLYAAVSRATEQVVLSYCSSDEEGNLALPSPFVADLRELLGEAWFARRDRRLLADVVWPAAGAPTERERRRAEAAALAPAAGEPPDAQRRLGAGALARLRHTEIVSAGALEAYGDCPVKWLVERELDPTALEPEPEPITRGNLIHAVLEALLEELDGPLDAASLADAETALDRHLRDFAAGPGAGLGAGQPEVVRAGLLRGIRADLLRYLRHEAARGAGWRRHGLELRFGFDPDGDGGSLPALALGGVRVRGMIDRVDVDGAGHALITDYKSGAARSEQPAARWSADRRLQVALYLLVVRELTALDPVAGFYQPLRGEDLRARGMYVDGTELGTAAHPRDHRSAQEFTDELDDAAQRATALAGALRAGLITPCPQNCSRDGCAHPGICRSQ